jgi:hypothetical protein
MAKGAQGGAMFDYDAGAELFSRRTGKHQKRLGYQRFPHAADAIRFAIESLPPEVLHGAQLEVNEVRFGAAEIRRLYDDALYPLERRPVNADVDS